MTVSVAVRGVESAVAVSAATKAPLPSRWRRSTCATNQSPSSLSRNVKSRLSSTESAFVFYFYYSRTLSVRSPCRKKQAAGAIRRTGVTLCQKNGLPFPPLHASQNPAEAPLEIEFDAFKPLNPGSRENNIILRCEHCSVDTPRLQ